MGDTVRGCLQSYQLADFRRLEVVLHAKRGESWFFGLAPCMKLPLTIQDAINAGPLRGAVQSIAIQKITTTLLHYIVLTRQASSITHLVPPISVILSSTK